MGDPSSATQGVKGDRSAFGREWRVGPNAELVAAAIRLPDFTGPEHRHAEAQVAILLSGGAATFTHEGLLRRVPSPILPGSFVYIPGEEPHRTQWQGWTELFNVYWEEPYLRALADQTGCRLKGSSSRYLYDPSIPAIGRILMDEFIRAGELSPMMIDHARALIASRLLQIVEERSRRGVTGLLSQRRLQASIDAMVASPEKDFTLLELAQLCHSSVFHFSRSFSAHLGRAPFAFRRQLRVQRACALLTSTDLSIESISGSVGIASPTSFSRLFRRVTGRSPREYRQSCASAAVASNYPRGCRCSGGA